MKKIQLPEHEIEFNALHTKITLNKILACQNELLKTQNELTCTKETLLKNCSDLTTTREDLSLTQSELKETKASVATMENELLTTRIDLSVTRVKVQETSAILTTTRSALQDVHPVLLMTEVIQQSQSTTTQPSYTSNILRLCNLINNGEIYHIDEGKMCLFKLRIPPRTDRMLYIELCKDVKIWRHEDTIFSNEFITLNDAGVGLYFVLRVSIKQYGRDNCECYLIDLTHSGMNRLLEHGCSRSLDWESYRNEMQEVLFYFKKK